MDEHDSVSVVEDLTIQPVPESQRDGKVKHLFSFWFTVQIIPLSVVTGILGPTIYHLDLASTITALVIGNVIGAVFMALHSAQGPTLGVPQMIQARGQFGMYGSLLVIVVVILMYVGFFVSLMVLAQQTLVAVLPGSAPSSPSGSAPRSPSSRSSSGTGSSTASTACSSGCRRSHSY